MREVINFDFDWKFKVVSDSEFINYPNIDKPEYHVSKTNGEIAGPASVGYIAQGKDWQSAVLPHDYVISQAPDKNFSGARGFLKVSKAWYRKSFKLSEEDRSKRITLYFEGIMGLSEIYINACLVHRSSSGYVSFEVDITDYVEFDGINAVAVFTDPEKAEGWWYNGGGIYRHVKLIKTPMQSIDLWGVFVCPKKEESGWSVPIETTIRNDDSAAEEITLTQEIKSPDGIIITQSSQNAELEPFSKKPVGTQLRVNDPVLWSVKNPELYSLITTVYKNGEQQDQVINAFGFRTIYFDPENGFYLNGEKTLIKGVCCHQDYGLTGRAMPDRIHTYRMKLLKEMGSNAYRAAHYMTGEETLNAADKLGFLVMCETRKYHSSPEGIGEMEALVKRDRNHPSVIIWSIGNEEPLHISDKGRRITKHLVEKVKKLDNSRYITTAVCDDPLNAKVYDDLSLIGLNYNLECLDELHKKYPDKPIHMSECCASSSTRGWYFDDCPEIGYYSAYDHRSGISLGTREHTYQVCGEREWIAGTFQWAGIEHRGETYWPRLCSQSGALDLFLQKKDAFYQMQSFWLEEPMIHILPHWNLAGREGEPINVWLYTNCDEAELFVNGVSLGRKKTKPFTHLEWTVPYRPGTVKAIGFNNGIIAAEEEISTTGKPKYLNLKLEDDNIKPDGQDIAVISCFCTDEYGNTVPDASPVVTFFSNKAGRIVGTGSDVCDHVPMPSHERRMRAGVISLAVQTTGDTGILRVMASAEGLEPARLDIKLNTQN